MPEHALKCENNEAIFDQKQFIAFKMAFSCCFSLGGNLDFPGFLQKFFYNINYCTLYLDPQFSLGRLTLWPLQQVVFFATLPTYHN